jgi:hypothetical protein
MGAFSSSKIILSAAVSMSSNGGRIFRAEQDSSIVMNNACTYTGTTLTASALQAINNGTINIMASLTGIVTTTGTVVFAYTSSQITINGAMSFTTTGGPYYESDNGSVIFVLGTPTITGTTTASCVVAKGGGQVQIAAIPSGGGSSAAGSYGTDARQNGYITWYVNPNFVGGTAGSDLAVDGNVVGNGNALLAGSPLGLLSTVTRSSISRV